MSRKRKPKLRRVAGGERRPHSKPVRRFSYTDILEWWKKHKGERPFAASASRKLRFSHINRLLKDRPPTLLCDDGYRIYLFCSGEDRDQFVEEFYGEFRARAMSLGAYNAS